MKRICELVLFRQGSRISPRGAMALVRSGG
jgi:hypothetical protein